jgi:EAL domain-containing protein (putative c-di-GMP-specific phosphodiesterase class I)
VSASSQSSGLPPVIHVLPRGRLLIVDDEERLAFAYGRFLRARGYVVQIALDAEAALDAIDTGEFDAIFSEVAMPRMGGTELLAAVRKKNKTIPFVVLTATATTETAVQAVEHGALRYLVKPVSMPELERTAESAMLAGRAATAQRRASEIASHHDEEEATRSERMDHLSRALDAVYMVYQPIVSLRVRQPVGYEALARSRDTRFPNPGVLFSEAERFNQVQALGRIIRGQVKDTAESMPPGARLFVNLHTTDLQDPSLYDLTAPLSQVAARVVLEITERGSIDDVPGIEEKIGHLRSIGYRIALDDIGSGYANLNTFAVLEPDIVKLDMALVRDIHTRATKQRVVSAMVDLCRDMKIELVAEGVENQAELDTLQSLGCELFQGYFFARPGPAFPIPKL